MFKVFLCLASSPERDDALRFTTHRPLRETMVDLKVLKRFNVHKFTGSRVDDEG